MAEEWVNTMILDLEKVQTAIKSQEQRHNALALEQSNQGALQATHNWKIDNLDRSMGYVVDHQIKSTKHLQTISSTIDGFFAQMQILNTGVSDVISFQASLTGEVSELTGTVKNFTRAIYTAMTVVGVGIGLVILALIYVFYLR